MRKINVILLTLTMVWISACTKSESPTTKDPVNNGGGTTPTYYFTCKVNGVLQNFSAMTLIKDDTNDVKQLYLVGSKSNAEPQPSILFVLNIKPSGWVDGITYVMDEKDLVNTVEFKNPALQTFKSTATPSSATSGLTIKFDKIIMPKGQYASGTFSGTLQLEENVTSVKITEGKFKVQFLN